MHRARVGLVAAAVAALIVAAVVSGQQAKPEAPKGVPKESGFGQLGLADIGWDKTVSTVAFTGGLSGYYDEMKAQLGK